MSITYAGIIYEDGEAPRHVLLAEVERLRAAGGPENLALVAFNVRAERARIREELLAEAGLVEDGDEEKYWCLTDFYLALDRICPEEPA